MVKITETRMTAEINGCVIAEATRTAGVWHATRWPTPLTYNQAITALTIAELVATGADEADPCVMSLREELTGG
ncbi:hypothetical protein Acsp04_35340 [Actinomadura sp. NBRC 104425]|uniref:hypothetical protein n=1 Tax=Actinomadura sp. NBRC 104425 TaxID=3032204 RepID=UPI00249FB0C5|nr:hypothetical protein [Actinomadura sp. NBRC 104425]GLZ13299.1 hypothetical protein Acsp04_35340 [Actinomadura sp. NBRC 104425]